MVGNETRKVLDGQVALVTGASRGIGKVIAIHLARAGALLAVTARDRSKLEETIQGIEEEGGKGCGYAMEVTDAESVRGTVERIRKDLGPVDLLVNNAGVVLVEDETCPWESDPEDWWRVLEVNLKGVFLCCQTVLPEMVNRGKGRIINLGSNAAISPNPGASAYSVSKAALLRLTDTFAEAAKGTGVCIFAISPGMVRTDMTASVPWLWNQPESAWTSVEVSADACVTLASGRADALNGRYIHVREDDLVAMMEDAPRIVENDLHVLRLRRT